MSPEETDPGLRMTVHRAPPGLLDRAVQRRIERPRRLQVALALAATFACGLMLGDKFGPTEAPSESGNARLVFYASNAHEVAVAGTWNDWEPEPMMAVGQGTFVWDQALPRGQHEYMFLVDGRWVTDPSARVVRDDGFGNRNALLEI